jgi:hypothetical protein
MKTKYSRLTLACVALFGFAMMGDDCQGDIVNDPAFRDWCGANLCAWQTDYGQIQRVPTWIAEDFGVSFLDNADGRPPGTEISQVTQENGATCILFTSVGNIDPQANMVVKADFDNDGTIDYTAPLGAANWTQVQTEITAPAGYNGITFYVAKEGTGTAVLAEMRIQSTTGCTAPPPALNPLFSLGGSCAATSECKQGLVCALEGDAGTGYCSQCSAESPCTAGVACAQRSVFLPFQCGPGDGLGASTAPCIADSDCQSGVCLNATPTPLLADAGTCDLNTIAPSDPANCSWFSAIGGTCQ